MSKYKERSSAFEWAVGLSLTAAGVFYVSGEKDKRMAPEQEKQQAVVLQTQNVEQEKRVPRKYAEFAPVKTAQDAPDYDLR